MAAMPEPLPRQAANREPIAIFRRGRERRDPRRRRGRREARRPHSGTSQHRRAERGDRNLVSFTDIAHMVGGSSAGSPRRQRPRPGPRPHLVHRIRYHGLLESLPDFRYTSLADGIARVHREIGESVMARSPACQSCPRANATSTRAPPPRRRSTSGLARVWEVYFDGPREYGYGGYRYGRAWLPVAHELIAHFDLKPGRPGARHRLRQGILVKDC